MMSTSLKWALLIGAVAGLSAAAAIAAAPAKKERPNTPPNWSWELKGDKRVPRVPRVTHQDGSWTEEYREANCTVTRTGRAGEVRETRKC